MHELTENLIVTLFDRYTFEDRGMPVRGVRGEARVEIPPEEHCIIHNIMRQLSPTFNGAEGNFDSFEILFVRKDGEIWTHDPRVVDRLVMLGLAAGCLRFSVPRQYWHLFPDSEPHFYLVLPQ